jgi:trehalose 6-phosphate synthase
MTEVDVRQARANGGRIEVDLNGHQLAVSFVTPSPTQYQRYYDEVSNSVLWFLQHNITNPPTHPTFDQALWEAWEHGYVAVNRQFADALAAAADLDSQPPVFMIHDYHLYLVPGLLRQRFPDAPIQHFTHIAWPSPDAWRQLPSAIREAILVNMLGSDVVGFHCERYALNFLRTCDELLGLPVDWDARAVTVDERVVRVRAYPISIDPAQLLAMVDDPEVKELERTFMANRPPRLILQVARTDPSKNILRSFHAYEHFLALYPQYVGEVQFLGLLPASRQTTELYKEYFDELCQVAHRINEEYARPGWLPIELFFENDYARAIAAMKRYDVLVVNSIADGMNLVAKEGPIVNQRAGVLLLSEAAGAVDELGGASLVVNPFDLVGMANAFHEALAMPLAERQQALAAQRTAIAANTIYRWAHDQLADLVPGEARPGKISMFPLVENRWEVPG